MILDLAPQSLGLGSLPCQQCGPHGGDLVVTYGYSLATSPSTLCARLRTRHDSPTSSNLYKPLTKSPPTPFWAPQDTTRIAHAKELGKFFVCLPSTVTMRTGKGLALRLTKSNLRSGQLVPTCPLVDHAAYDTLCKVQRCRVSRRRPSSPRLPP